MPSYFGHSIGHWEGDTLVIETVGFNERTWMSRDALPHTDQMHMIERHDAHRLQHVEVRGDVRRSGRVHRALDERIHQELDAARTNCSSTSVRETTTARN